MHELEHKCLDLAICIQRNVEEFEDTITINLNEAIREKFIELFKHDMDEQHAEAIIACVVVVGQGLTSSCAIWSLAHGLFHELFQSPEGPSH